MLGFRGASRYYDERYREGFALECRAMRKVREEMGLTNVKLMVPFCRTVEEGRRVLAEMAGHGLRAGRARPRGLRDVRDPEQRDPGRGVRRGLRRLLDRQQRPDAAHARRRPRFGARRAPLRRAQRRGASRLIAQVIRARARCRPEDRHLRPGAERLPGVRPVPRRRRGSTASRSTRIPCSRRCSRSSKQRGGSPKRAPRAATPH